MVNPDNSSHYARLERAPQRYEATLGGAVIASSEGCVIVREHGRREHPPVVYFPREALVGSELEALPKRTRCPLKGTASYFELRVGDRLLAEAVWSYEEVLAFDERLEMLRGLVAFAHPEVHVRAV